MNLMIETMRIIATEVTNSDVLSQTKFFPEQISFSDMLGIISVILGCISIILALIIYRLSNDTAQKFAEEVAQRAFEKQKSALLMVRPGKGAMFNGWKPHLVRH